MLAFLRFVLAASATGCSLLGGVRVEPLGSGEAPPGNVATYVAVTRGDEPVTDLSADDFAVYEDEQTITSEQTQQLLLERELVATHRTVLLVDVSTASTPALREQLGRAVAGFVEKVRPGQSVTVFAFAGGPLRLLGEYPRGSGPAPRPLGMATLGTSRNLNGAVRQGLLELDQRLALSQKPLRIGTLVVFAAGPDVARRVDDESLDANLEATKHRIVVISDGPEPEPELRALARGGLVAAQAADTLPIAFEEAAYKVRALYEMHYLLAYCSPAREGERRLRLEVRVQDEDGDFRTGDISRDFSARGFARHCNPRVVPSFATKSAPRPRPERGAPPPEAEPAPQGEPAAESGDESDDRSVVPPPDSPGYAQ